MSKATLIITKIQSYVYGFGQLNMRNYANWLHLKQSKQVDLGYSFSIKGAKAGAKRYNFRGFLDSKDAVTNYLSAYKNNYASYTNSNNKRTITAITETFRIFRKPNNIKKTGTKILKKYLSIAQKYFVEGATSTPAINLIFIIKPEDYMLPCLNKKLFGFDCMGCGIQRSTLLLFNGEFYNALKMYPAIFTLVPLAALIIMRLFFKNKTLNKIINYLAILSVTIIIVNFLIKLIN